MVPTDIARTVIPIAVAIAIGVLPILLVILVSARLTRRRVPRWLAALLPISIAVWLGYALLVSDQQPLVRAAALLGVAVLIAITGLRGWLDAAGLVLIGAALPWAMFATAWLLDGVIAARRIDPARAMPPFVTSVVAIVVGFSILRFHRQYTARHPPPPPPAEPTRRHWDTVARTIAGPAPLGLSAPVASTAVALFLGSLISVSVAHGRPILEAIAIVIAGAIATGLATTLAWALGRPPASRRAFEAFAWLGEWELQRYRGLVDGPASVSMTGLKRYVRNTAERPDDRWLRTDILAAIGELDGAREMAARIPDDTPYGRVERLAGLSYVDWLSGGPGDTAGVRAAADGTLPVDSDERLRAEVIVAAGQVRDRVSAGDPDPAAPLREARARLGRRADGVLLAVGRRIAPTFLWLSGAFVAIFTLIDHTTSF